MFLKSNNKSECCGCTACVSICPKKCLKMGWDFEGFKYPVFDDKEKCIGCGLCEKVCPIAYQHEKKKDTNDPVCYYGWHNDSETRQNSTSGAAFIAMAETAKIQGYNHIYGAAYSDNHIVFHTCISQINELNKLQTSKYVQSDLGNTFLEIRDKIRKGEKVLFSGTPCQVEGLRKYIGYKNANNLLTIALICHGVASPKCFSKYISEVEDRENDKVESIKFRDKKNINGKLSHKYTTITYKSEKTSISDENIYTLAFGIGLINRKSCAVCPFTTPYRLNDITIGDFWGAEKYNTDLRTEISNGISLILVHTDKGIRFVEELKDRMFLENIEMHYAINPQQQQLIRPMSSHPSRDSFMEKVLLNNKSFHANAISIIRRWKIKRSIGVRIARIRKAFIK